MTRSNIAIVGHDAGCNALGRALVLADLLDPLGSTHIVAFGDRIWPPARAGRPVELLKPCSTTAGLPAAAGRLRDAVRGADLIVAVKPRIMSYGLSVIIRDRRPLILDVDDREDLFTRRRLGWIRQFVEPDREPVTRLLGRWHRRASAVTVASRALQRRYGGTWVPHVRDRSDLASSARDGRATTRARLGLGDDFVVGFVGTIRPHKGLTILADAVGRLGAGARLLIAGDLGNERDLQGLATRSAGRLVTTPGPLLHEIGAILGACDVVAIPQSRQPEAIYQSPAKLLDALAAGVPMVASDIGDAAELVGDAARLVPPDDVTALAAALAELRDSPAARVRLGALARSRNAEAYSLGRWQKILADVAEPLVNGRRPA